MLSSGDIVLANIQFVDTFEVKKRPALVLFEESGNVVIAGITSNLNMDGVKISKKDGAIKDSIVKLNYLFTISEIMIEKKLFSLNSKKKKEVYDLLLTKLNKLVM